MTQRKLLKLILLIAATVIVTGCDSIPFIDNSSEYKGASRGRPLEVPPDLTAASASDTYSVPGGTTYSTYAQGEANQPQEAEKLLPTSDSVKFEHAGSQRWLVVQAPPEKVWPVIRDFWTELGFAVRVEDPQTGVMETEWVDPADLVKDAKGNYLDKFQGWLDKLSSLNNRQKFRTRIDRGGEEATTEIYMSHRSISDATDDGHNYAVTKLGRIDTGFKAKNQDERAVAEDIDAELLRRLMVRLGVEEKKSRTLIASPIIEQRAILNKEADGALNLALNDQFDRAWRRVGLALDRIGFLVEDRDRSRGVFFVRYSDIEQDEGPQDKKGLLDKLKFWGDDDKKETPKPEPKKADKPLTDKLKFWDSGDKDQAPSEQQYRVKVEQTETGTLLTVTDKSGKRDKSSTANRILSMLYDQLK
jgi:outer membrane protein assembly factor BamC